MGRWGSKMEQALNPLNTMIFTRVFLQEEHTHADTRQKLERSCARER